ncbi:Ras family protein [Trichomonas vaginalis G3]|uniref:Ras family protein n=1 Tax=Trichomonas vaginalis (strain ATCC PRA-98 / G3) TaxID=412133 RepID=A2DYG4_TRIV3|nr:Golgi to endosome transport [Trichomonas vaginalis G3]EAY14499.1 Ras family protein [Trichomonas vaginalis G3]KAI5529328.1 Golgi to endosome transport [Trichomonas vaginalis G3]|eukprot:XP_001326722.1 Ras family protein [Trichomonas vaginalis G3]
MKYSKLTTTQFLSLLELSSPTINTNELYTCTRNANVTIQNIDDVFTVLKAVKKYMKFNIFDDIIDFLKENDNEMHDYAEEIIKLEQQIKELQNEKNQTQENSDHSLDILSETSSSDEPEELCARIDIESIASEKRILKLVVMGDTEVGKTCLLNRLIKNVFTVNTPKTIGLCFSYYYIHNQKGRILLHIWDVAGEEKYRTITSNFYKSTDFALICFDLTNKASFKDLESWYTEIIKNATPGIKFVIVGNKKDCDENRVVTSEEAMNFAKSHGAAFYIETSAKTGANVRELFLRIAQ